MLDYNVSGKKGGFSPTEVKPAAVELSKKRTAAPVPANDTKRMASQHAVHSSETKAVEKSDKEQLPVKHIAKRKAPPPPTGVKKNTAVPSSQPEPEASLSHGDTAHSIAHTKKPPGSPVKRPAPAVPMAAKQHATRKPMLKYVSDSVLTTQQAPPSPLKTLPSTTEDVTDHQGSPSLSIAKKRRPAPTRPAPHVQHKLESGMYK